MVGHMLYRRGVSAYVSVFLPMLYLETAAEKTPPVPVMTTAVSATCPKCGITASGKSSCCFRGGTWFRKCGDVNLDAEHTWFEGIQACKSVSPFLGETQLKGSVHANQSSCSMRSRFNRQLLALVTVLYAASSL